MVAKINVGSSLYGVLAYNQKKMDEMEADVLFAHRMFESEDGRFSLRQSMESFEMFLPQDIRTEKPIIHISLNPHPDDKLSDAQLSQIAQEYMDMLGYGNQPYIVYKHEDIERPHIHIVSLRVDEQGRKLNDKFEYRRSKEITRKLEEKYGLRPAERSKSEDISQLSKLDYQAGDIKKQVSNTVKSVMSSYRFQSFGEFKTLLSLYNIHAEEVKGEIRGRSYHGIVYSATDDKGEKKGNPIKSSLIGKSVGVITLDRNIRQTGELWKTGTLRLSIKDSIQEVLNQSTSIDQFRDDLKKKGVDVVIRQNDDGRIYGVTFIDHENRIVFNGSRLGKEFSANAIHKRFQSGAGFEVKNKPLKQTSHQSTKDETDSLNQYSSDYQNQTISKESLIGDIFKMLLGNQGNHDDNYYSYSGKRKRKRKRRFGRQN